MLDTLAAQPFWLAFLALFASATVRSNGTYWLGRGAMAGWRRHRGSTGVLTGELTGELTGRAQSLLRRLGPFAVTLSYLTVGLQTAIHLAAGAARMPLRHYLPAAVVGSLVWAALYATVGLAVVQAWLAAEAGSWWGAAVLVLGGAAVVAWLVVRRRRAEWGPSPRADTLMTSRSPPARSSSTR
ncbi:DedA family protein [Terrabacter terrae]